MTVRPAAPPPKDCAKAIPIKADSLRSLSTANVIAFEQPRKRPAVVPQEKPGSPTQPDVVSADSQVGRDDHESSSFFFSALTTMCVTPEPRRKNPAQVTWLSSRALAGAAPARELAPHAAMRHASATSPASRYTPDRRIGTTITGEYRGVESPGADDGAPSLKGHSRTLAQAGAASPAMGEQLVELESAAVRRRFA